MKKETILDHNITEEELKAILFSFNDFPDPNFTKNLFIKHNSQDDHYLFIKRLYRFRGDEATAEKYYNKVSEEKRKELETPDTEPRIVMERQYMGML